MNKTLVFLTCSFLAGITGVPASQAQTAGGPFDPLPARILSDPLYLPLAGQIYGATSYSFANPESDSWNSFPGGRRSSFSSTGYNNSISQSLAYGLTDDLELHASVAYGWNQTDTTFDTGATSSAHANGFTDPGFGVTWRVLDQALQSPVDLDLAFSYAPDAIASKAPGDDRDGSIAPGRDRADFGITVGREMNAFTIAGTVTASYLGDRSYQSLANGDFFNQDSGWDYTIGVNTQTRLTDQWSVNAGLGYVFTDDLRSANTTRSLPFTARPPNNFEANAALNYAFIPDRLVGGLTYTHDEFGDSENDYFTLASSNGTTNHASNTFGVRLQYVLD